MLFENKRKRNVKKLNAMNTKKYLGTLAISIFGAAIVVFVYAQFFNKREVVYQNYQQPVRLASYTGVGQQAVDFTYAAEQTVHGVVHVTTKSEENRADINPIYEFFYGNTRKEPIMGIGSGVIASPDGYIITNHHVIKDADEISVKLNDNRIFDAKLVGVDPSTDLALLKIDAKDLSFIPFGNSEELKLGEWVLAVGNPFNLTSTVTAGIVSAKARNLNILNDNYKIESFIQTDAALNPGNSGGALVNVRGELVGINTAIISPNGGYAGNSFAIPVTIVKKVYDDLREFGVVQRAVLGVVIKDVNAEIAKQNNLDKIQGIYISEVKDGSSASDAGMKIGDVVVKINNMQVNNTSELQEQIGKYRPKDKVSIIAIRDGKEKTFDVVLKNMQGDTQIVKADEGFSIMGAKFSELTTEEKQKMGIRYGVKIIDLASGKFSNAGIEKGFIITRLNNKSVESVADIKNILNNTKGGLYIEGMYPNGVIAYYAFGL
jgi:serine protease Do